MQTTSSNGARLLGDIGGTNARFAWQASVGSPLTHIASLRCDEHENVESAIRKYLSAHDLEIPARCAIGIANPVEGDVVRMTNHHWSFSISALRDALALKQLLVLNDFAALAMSLPSLGASDLLQIGQGRAVNGGPIAVLGPGTGLGVSGLFLAGSRRVAIRGEGGHVSLPAANAFEAAVVQILQRRFGHASAERALSGPGLVNLYGAVCELIDEPPRPYSPAEVLTRGCDASDAHCASALKLFFSFLGGVAGNLALTLGASGGVYIGGGIIPRITGELERSNFRLRFENKGRFRDYLGAIPTWAITTSVSPALMGAACALDQDDSASEPTPLPV